MSTVLGDQVVVLRAASRLCDAFLKVVLSAQTFSISLAMSRVWSLGGVSGAFGLECCLGGWTLSVFVFGIYWSLCSRVFN